MYDMAIKEYMSQTQELKQAKACKGTQKILGSKSRQGSIHERLYDHGARKKSKDARDDYDANKLEGLTFVPKINKMAKNMARSGKIEDRLLADAKKRIVHKKSQHFERLKTLKKEAEYKKGNKSTDMVFKKFVAEYEKALTEMCKAKADPFSPDELSTILIKLGFITQEDLEDKVDNSSTDIWIILGGEAQDHISETSIFNILCIIQNYNYSFLYSEQYMTPSKRHVE